MKENGKRERERGRVLYRSRTIIIERRTLSIFERRHGNARPVRNYDVLLFIDTIITITRYHYRQTDRHSYSWRPDNETRSKRGSERGMADHHDPQRKSLVLAIRVNHVSVGWLGDAVYPRGQEGMIVFDEKWEIVVENEKLDHDFERFHHRRNRMDP